MKNKKKERRERRKEKIRGESPVGLVQRWGPQKELKLLTTTATKVVRPRGGCSQHIFTSSQDLSPPSQTLLFPLGTLHNSLMRRNPLELFLESFFDFSFLSNWTHLLMLDRTSISVAV